VHFDGIGIVAIEAAELATRHKQHKAHARTIHSTAHFERVHKTRKPAAFVNADRRNGAEWFFLMRHALS